MRLFAIEDIPSTELSHISDVTSIKNKLGTESSETEAEVAVCGGVVKPERAVPMAVMIAVLCFSGNSLVIYIYSRSEEIAEIKIFELAFAFLDILAGLLLLPRYFLRVPFAGLCRNEYVIKFSEISLTVAGPLAFAAYYSLLVCVAIDRFCAVFYPLQFKIMRKGYIRKMLLTVVVFQLLVAVSTKLVSFFRIFSYLSLLYFLAAIVAIVVIVILFTAIVVRIRRNSAQRAALGVGGQDAQHMKAVKIFSLITAFYLLGYVPFGLALVDVLPAEFGFLYYVNHVCNPIIYFAINDQFRRDVIAVFKRCCRK